MNNIQRCLICSGVIVSVLANQYVKSFIDKICKCDHKEISHNIEENRIINNLSMKNLPISSTLVSVIGVHNKIS